MSLFSGGGGGGEGNYFGEEGHNFFPSCLGEGHNFFQGFLGEGHNFFKGFFIEKINYEYPAAAGAGFRFFNTYFAPSGNKYRNKFELHAYSSTQ